MAKKNKKKNEIIFFLAGFLLIFGVSGLIYGLLPYPLIIGSVSVVVGFLLTFILMAIKRKKRR